MKKLLTIVALALILCLGISAALAATLSEKQQIDIAEKLANAGVLAKSEDFKLADLTVDTDSVSGSFTWSYAGTEMKGAVLDCVTSGEASHTYGTAYKTYTYWDATKAETVSIGLTEKYDLVKKGKCAPDALVDSTGAALGKTEAQLAHYGDICNVQICTICGKLKTSVSTGKTGHDLPDAISYTTNYKAAAANKVALTTQDEINAWICNPANKDVKLYSYKECACGYVEYKEVAKGKGGHSYPDEMVVVKASTCIEKGYKAYQCKVCKELKKDADGNVIKKDLPLADHSYTKKVYEFQKNPDKKPNCETGLIFVYTYQCPNCEQYEGNLIDPDFVTYGHIDNELTFDDKVKLLGWAGDITENVKRYDTDGHHYSKPVAEETGVPKYSCMGGYYWTFACEHCGKKLVITNGENKATYTKKLVDKVEYTDCTTAKITYKCDACEGKVAGHKITKDETLLPSDPLAHNEGKFFIEDLTKYVAPTCLDAGSRTFVCTECGYVKTETVAKEANHLYGEFVKVSDNVWKKTCVRCGAVVEVKGQKDQPKAEKWVKVGSGTGTCLEPSYVEYKKVNADGTDAKNADGTLVKAKVLGEYGEHILSKVGNYAGEKKATCAEKGIELWICARCTNYNPNTPNAKTIAECMSAKKAGMKPYYKVVETEKVEHTWGKPVVVPATAEKDGTSTKTCTVCGETEVTVIPYEKADAFYKLTNVKYDGTSVTGKLTHVDGTKEAETIKVRVTFYIEGNYYMATMAEVAADGSFSVDGVGPIKYITVAVTGNSSVNPEDYQKIAEPEEIFVK